MQNSATETQANPRDEILSAIKKGFNTLSGIRRQTGLTDSKILHEIEILEELEIERKPGPPVTSFWLKGKAPEGRVVIAGGGKAIEVIEPPPPVKPEIPEPVKKIEKSNGFDYQTQLPAIAGGDVFRPDVPVGVIVPNPDNPRGWVDTEEQEFTNLAASIKEVGIQEPLIITPMPNGLFRNVMGHRRFAAAVRAGLEVVPCIIRTFPSKTAEIEAMCIENIQRKDLTPTQEATAFEKILRQNKNDIHAVARKTGLLQSYIKFRLVLLQLDVGLQIMVDRGEINITSAVILSGLEHTKQRRLAARASTMKTADLKILVERIKNPNSAGTAGSRRKLDRVTTDEEKFTRSWAIKEMDKLGSAWMSVDYIRASFDDVCLDTCLEHKDESLCEGCPVPRFIASLLRRKERAEK